MEDMVLLPHWAVAVNEKNEPVLHAQVCTKDGRRVGNGFISHIQPHYKYGGFTYTVITDKGTKIVLLEEELHELYWVGNYICKPDHNIEKDVFHE